MTSVKLPAGKLVGVFCKAAFRKGVRCVLFHGSVGHGTGISAIAVKGNRCVFVFRFGRNCDRALHRQAIVQRVLHFRPISRGQFGCIHASEKQTRKHFGIGTNLAYFLPAIHKLDLGKLNGHVPLLKAQILVRYRAVLQAYQLLAIIRTDRGLIIRRSWLRRHAIHNSASATRDVHDIGNVTYCRLRGHAKLRDGHDARQRKKQCHKACQDATAHFPRFRFQGNSFYHFTLRPPFWVKDPFLLEEI